MAIIPNSRPQLTKEKAESILASFQIANPYPVKLLGIRGYYMKTMGNPVKNDSGIYDDAIFLVTPDVFLAANGNTDPSRVFKGVAVVTAPQTILYKIGMHNMKNPYKAFRQFGRVTVLREGSTHPQTDTKDAPFYIDVHKGGYGTTSSLGCQTIYPDQWENFLATAEKEMKKHNQEIIPYNLISY